MTQQKIQKEARVYKQIERDFYCGYTILWLYKTKQGLINLKKIETDFYCGFGKLVDLTVFQCSFLLFVINDDVLHEAVILSFKGNFSSFISPGPGSAVGEKGKNPCQIGKISAKGGSRAVAWGGGKGRRHPFPSSDYLSARFYCRYFSPVFQLRSLVPS